MRTTRALVRPVVQQAGSVLAHQGRTVFCPNCSVLIGIVRPARFRHRGMPLFLSQFIIQLDVVLIQLENRGIPGGGMPVQGSAHFGHPLI